MTAAAIIARLQAQVCEAHAEHRALEIRGHGSKRFYGNAFAERAELLDMRPLTGIISYEPTELVITAYAGTPLAEIEALLAKHGQCLPCEPPRFVLSAAAGRGTLGGAVASGLNGPARRASGPLRDYVLGVTLINGRGELLRFGGQVMKNVAGYDVSRLLVGSLGILGVLCEISLKVLPRPAATETLVFPCTERWALTQANFWFAQSLPVQAVNWCAGVNTEASGELRVRLCGAQAAVLGAQNRFSAEGGKRLPAVEAALWWDAVRDQQHSFFLWTDDDDKAASLRLWRLSLPPTTPPLSLPEATEQWIEWGGALRWWRTSAPAAVVRDAASAVGGHATLFRGATEALGCFAPLDAVQARLHQQIKAAFDPRGIFNRGRLYPDL